MAPRDILGIFAGVLVLAGLSMVVTNGGQVASIFSAGGEAFSRVINAATLRG